MISLILREGSKVAVIELVSDGTYSTRLYVNNGETATLISAKTKTRKGAEKQAVKMLAKASR